jgi:endonuclease/exonuclease/phosphatase family metal-dependent hydrolase
MKKLFKWILKIVVLIILVAGGFVGYLTLTEYKPEPIETVDIEQNPTNQVAANQTLTFMTFNTGYAGLGEDEDFVMDGGQKGRPDNKSVVEGYLSGIEHLITSNVADFYLLQEVDLKARRSFDIDQVNHYKALLPTYHSTFAYNFNAVFVPFPVSLTDYIGPVKSGIQTLGRFEVESSERHQFPGEFSWPLRVANLKRAMMVNTYTITGSTKKLVVVNLHMSAYDGDGSLRAQEMGYLKAFMEAQTALGNYVIIGGDFNQTFPTAIDVYPTKPGLYQAYPIESSFLPAGYQWGIDITEPTCRLLNQPYEPTSELTQYYIIDGFIVSNNITVGSVQVIQDDFQFSDHNPVFMTVTLN